jgi:hypothetical protein
MAAKNAPTKHSELRNDMNRLGQPNPGGKVLDAKNNNRANAAGKH